LKQTPRHAELNSLLDVFHCTCTKDLIQLNTRVLCDVTPHTSVDGYQWFWENYCFHLEWSIFYHDHGVSSFPQHVCTHLWTYVESHPRWL